MRSFIFFMLLIAWMSAHADTFFVRQLSAIVVEGPDGMRTSCADIDEFAKGKKDSTDVVFNVEKSKWTHEMSKFLEGEITSCYNVVKTFDNQYQIQEIQDKAYAKYRAIENENERIEIATKKAQHEKEHRARELQYEEEQLSAEQKRGQVATCKNTKPYLLFNFQEKIIENLEWKAIYEANLKEERKISQVSGVSDLRRLHDNSTWLVRVNESLKQEWSAYKSYGGLAASPKKVTHQFKDPCTQLESASR